MSLRCHTNAARFAHDLQGCYESVRARAKMEKYYTEKGKEFRYRGRSSRAQVNGPRNAVALG